jgi:general L-amino acid transport system substrate-binding protein
MSRLVHRPVVRTLGVGALLACLVTAAGAQTLSAVKERGSVACGVSQGVLGFSIQAGDGQWSGFDADFCRALAAAIFDDSKRVTFVPLSAAERFGALQGKRIDVLSRNSTWTMSRETEFGLAFAGVTFYDGQGLMVRHSRKVSSGLELDDSKACVQTGTTTENNVREFFKTNGMKLEVIATRSLDEARRAYEAGQCNVLTADASALHGERLMMTDPNDHDILPELISKEPLGPVVRQDDFQWFNIVKWLNFAMLHAEEIGVGTETLDDALKSEQPEVRRLVGTDGNLGEQLGLTRDWMVRVIKQVGNYADVYDRNVGVKSKLGIPRGINQLWINGGILYAPPIR